MDGNGAPQSELVLRETEQVSDEREDHEGDGIQQEDNTERYGYLLLRCIDCGSYGGYRAATAYRRAGGYQMGGFARHFEPSAHEVAEYEDGRNRGDGEAQPFAAHLQGALHVHSEAKPYDRCLEQDVRGLVVELRIGMAEEQGEEKAADKGDGGGYVRGGTEYEGENESRFGEDFAFGGFALFHEISAFVVYSAKVTPCPINVQYINVFVYNFVL